MTERYTDTSDIQLGDGWKAVGCPLCGGRTTVEVTYDDHRCDWCEELFELDDADDDWTKPRSGSAEVHVVLEMDYERYREYHRAEPVLLRAFWSRSDAESFIDEHEDGEYLKLKQVELGE